MHEYYPEGFRINTDTNKIYTQSLFGLQKAMIEGKILEAMAISCDTERNLTVDFGFCKGIIPYHETALGIREGTLRDIAIISRVSHPVCFLVKSITENDDDTSPLVILSRADAQKLALENFVKALSPGCVVNAKITHMETFGAFVDISCGNIALLPIDCISVSRIEHPADRFRNGTHIKAVIKAIHNGRITVSHRELLGTWQENADNFFTGQTITGIVRSVEGYGAFIELAPNLSGLADPVDGLVSGQRVSVFIKSIIPEKMKIKLCVISGYSEISESEPLRYYIDSGRISEMRYSPECCNKEIIFSF